MAQTPNSASSSYCTAVEFLLYYSPSVAADMLRGSPESPRPSYLAMIDPLNPANSRLQTHLDAGAGEIEAACGIAKRYLPADLQALTGVSGQLLKKLNAARGMWSLYQKLKPGAARPEDCAGAKESFELLEALRDGQMIFGFLETQQAGLPSVVQAQPAQLLTPNVVGAAMRLFPNVYINRLNGGGN